MGMRSSKTFIKIEALTYRKYDVIFLSDCRMGKFESNIARMMGLNRNCSYKLYVNSSKDSRGVAIAVKRSIYHEVLDTYRSPCENLILCKVKIKNCVLTLGSVYGPNESNVNFFRALRGKIDEWGVPFIIGGGTSTQFLTIIWELKIWREWGGGGYQTGPMEGK